MKKILALLLAAVMVVGMAACGGSSALPLPKHPQPKAATLRLPPLPLPRMTSPMR